MLRIFVVDDNATARTAIKTALQQHSEWVVVGEADSGSQALETFRHLKPQLTLMDFSMPEMNGLETARRLTERNPDAQILMVTADPSNQLEQEARKAGIKGVCPKSKMDCLVQAIQTILGGGSYFHETATA